MCRLHIKLVMKYCKFSQLSFIEKEYKEENVCRLLWMKFLKPSTNDIELRTSEKGSGGKCE